MSKKAQTVTASCVLAGAAILTVIMLYLAVLFPKTVAVWADQGRQLSAGQVFAMNLSTLVKTFGLPLLGLLMLVVVASLVWLVVCIGAIRKESKANGVRLD